VKRLRGGKPFLETHTGAGPVRPPALLHWFGETGRSDVRLTFPATGPVAVERALTADEQSGVEEARRLFPEAHVSWDLKVPPQLPSAR
jgi:hypothetical protein